MLEVLEVLETLNPKCFLMLDVEFGFRSGFKNGSELKHRKTLKNIFQCFSMFSHAADVEFGFRAGFRSGSGVKTLKNIFQCFSMFFQCFFNVFQCFNVFFNVSLMFFNVFRTS